MKLEDQTKHTDRLDAVALTALLGQLPSDEEYRATAAHYPSPHPLLRRRSNLPKPKSSSTRPGVTKPSSMTAAGRCSTPASSRESRRTRTHRATYYGLRRDPQRDDAGSKGLAGSHQTVGPLEGVPRVAATRQAVDARLRHSTRTSENLLGMGEHRKGPLACSSKRSRAGFGSVNSTTTTATTARRKRSRSIPRTSRNYSWTAGSSGLSGCSQTRNGRTINDVYRVSRLRILLPPRAYHDCPKTTKKDENTQLRGEKGS